MSASSIEELIRAREVHNDALNELHTKINACKESMHNYHCLSDRISTLPEKLSHEVMVPFGKLAFMPGRLVHTNELLVHLGDSWFSEMTSKKAIKIIEERQQNLRSTLEDLEKVRKNIESKSEYLGEKEEAAKGIKDEVEIKEEGPSSYTHPKDRRRVSRMKNSAAEPSAGGKKLEEDEVDTPEKDLDAQDALMRRLDELERQEEEEDELYRISSSDDCEKDDGSGSPHAGETKPKHVRWKDGGGGVEEDDTRHSTPECCTIRFRHSKVQPTHQDGMTPGDVDRLVRCKAASKSILKKPRVSDTSLPGDGLNKGVEATLPKEQAITDTVVERTASTHEEPVADSIPARPVSRFKASRKKPS